MSIERSTLTVVTLIAAVAGVWAAWSAAKSGGDAGAVGSVVYVAVAGLLGRVFGDSAVRVVARSVLLLAGGVLALVASAFLGRAAGIRLIPSTA